MTTAIKSSMWKKPENLKIGDMRDYLLKRLEFLGAHVFKEAKSGSKYLKFADHRLGSIRIADHPGRTKYSYRWNLMCVEEYFFPSVKLHNRSQHKMHFYHMNDVDELIRHIINYHNVIKSKKG